MAERVQKILSQWGIASRRQAEQMILAKRVKLNGQIAELGQKADPRRDRLEVDGKVIAISDRPEPIYLLLNKPVGVVSTCSDPRQRPTVLSLLPSELRNQTGIHPVGRLDLESSGALILTNDGELTLGLTHPRYHLSKTYEVWLQGEIPDRLLQDWAEGVILDGKKTLPSQVKVLKKTPEKTLIQITLREGKNRQIRRIATQLGYPVIKLHRTAIASIRLQSRKGQGLGFGQYRFLEDFEIRLLKNQVNLTKRKENTAPGALSYEKN
jgi:23S rRNA pseudouridine2605 synthase